MTEKIFAVLGAGSWGTAIALHLSIQKKRVYLWGRDKNHIRHMIQSRENKRYLPGVHFPETLIPEANLKTCIEAASHCIIAVPSHAFAELLEQLPQTMTNLTWITKGLDPQKNQILSECVETRFGCDFPMAVISGPSFAKEVAKGLPTALVIAGNQPAHMQL